MQGKVDSGNLVTVEPIGNKELKVGDIVLCKVRGAEYLHLIKAIKEVAVVNGDRRYRFQIGNNRGRINGWIGLEQIYGKCSRVER